MNKRNKGGWLLMKNSIQKDQTLTSIEKNITAELAGKELWGDIAITKEDYENLRIRIKDILEGSSADILNLCQQFPNSIVTFMIFMARYRYDTNFWGLMSDELHTSPFDGSIQSEIGVCTQKAFKKNKFDYSDVKDERWKNIAPILYEAGLPPESGLDDLFYVLNYDFYSVFDPQLIIDDLIEMRSYQIRKPMLRFLKRFKGDRAVEFVLDVHDAMISVDQGMAGESHYIERYSQWKEREHRKETVNHHKKKEFQAKPYIMFDNGKRGLCLVMPRTIMNVEWVEEVEWIIIGGVNFETKKVLSVFGDEGKRYIESIAIPVSPSDQYKISLVDRESIDDSKLIEWTIRGIPNGGMLLFNANGRLVSPIYLQNPFGIVILSEGADITDSSYVNISNQVYPTNREGYEVKAIEALGRDSSVTIETEEKTYFLHARPQFGMSFQGKTLFSLSPNDRLFIEIPDLCISGEEVSNISGLELHLGKEILSLEDSFEEGISTIALKKYQKELFSQYGTYSIRLYQREHFLNQIEFCYLPKIKSDYSPLMPWPDYLTRKNKKKYKFQKSSEWLLEFNDCVVNSDEEYYTVECPSNIVAINGVLKSNTDENGFYCRFVLPIHPFEIDILDGTGMVFDSSTDKVSRLGLNDIADNEYWIRFSCFGKYKNYAYALKLRTVNGIEQSERICITHNGCVNYNLAVFYDTLRTCPLPAQLELCCEQDDEEKVLPLVIVSDTVQLNTRPKYNPNGYVVLGLEEGEKNLVIKRFGKETEEQNLLFSDSRLGKSRRMRGYPCKQKLREGLYTIESNMKESNFVFDDESDVKLTNGNNVMYVTSHGKDARINTFSIWLEQLIKDILKAGMNKNLQNCESYMAREKISEFEDKTLSECDYEKLAALACFVNDKCAKAKKDDIRSCMRTIAERILTADARLELIRLLADLQCSQEVFDICMQEYNLLIFSGGSEDAKSLAEKVERYSIEVSMLLLMSIDESIQNTIWRDKYREFVGKEAIRSLLSVPGENDPAKIVEEQKKFLREQPSCKVRINLTNEIVGDMEPIQQMMEITPKSIYLNKAKKPDFGIYFAQIRYIDQYVNWYSSSHNHEGEMLSGIRDKIVALVKENCKSIMDCVGKLKKDARLRDAVIKYEKVLQSRFNGNPMADLNTAKHNRYFYLQGMAALLAKIPSEFHYECITKTGEHFMAQAITIAPRIAKRDLIMAATYIYLMRKEEKLCR